MINNLDNLNDKQLLSVVCCNLKTKSECSHEEFFEQFVTEKHILTVSRMIGVTRIILSKDDAFNDIPLKEWDAIPVPLGTTERLEKVNEFLTLSYNVCINKAAARIIKQRGY
jgi:hypothetical protein